MTDDELRATAEMVIESLELYHAGKASQDDGIVILQGADDLARAYLAEHPADDAEPVTADWLLSLPGAGRPDETGPRIRVPAPGGRALDLFPWKGGWAVEAREQHPGGDYAGRVSLPDVHTRGHVRRLLAALGVTPGESR